MGRKGDKMKHRVDKLKNGKYTTQYQYQKNKDIWFYADKKDIDGFVPVEYDTPEEAMKNQKKELEIEIVAEYEIT